MPLSRRCGPGLTRFTNPRPGACSPSLVQSAIMRAARLRKLIARLHPHPVLAGAPADILKRQRHVRRHPRPTVQQARQRSALAAETRRRLAHVPAHIVHAFADEVAQMRRVAHRANAIAHNVVYGRCSHSVSGSRSGPRPRPRRPRSGTPRASCPKRECSTVPRGRLSGDAAGSPARRRCPDASPLTDGTGYAEAVARDRRAAAPRRRARAAPAVPCA